MLSSDRFLRDRGPVHFSVGPDSISRRGWADYRPRWIEADKLITSLVLSAHSHDNTVNAQQAIVLTDFGSAACTRARRFLSQKFPLLVLPSGVDLFWEMLFALNQPVVLCHASADSPDVCTGWTRAAQTLESLDPHASSQYFIDLCSEWSWPMGQPLLYEEGPGRTRLLELESKVERAWAKASRAWQKYSSDDIREQSKLISNRSGWGLGALALDPGGRGLQILTRTIELDPAGHGLGFGRHVKNEIEQWIRTCDVPEAEKIVSTIPSLALNAELKRNLQQAVQSVDIQFGWNPVQTIIDTILSRQNTVLVSLAPFPLMRFVYIGGHS